MNATESEKVAAFHRSRQMFIILGDKLHFAPKGVEWGHREWLERSGLVTALDTATRGFIDHTGIYVYHGTDFFGNGEDASQFCSHIREFPVPEDTFVFIGMVPGKPGKPGERWWPVHRLGAIKSLLGK
jgi:hypothetical protein